MAHFKKGSVLVKHGQRIDIAQKIAEIGNSGNTGEPHLHVHAQKSLPKESPLSGAPLFLSIGNEFYVRNDSITVD